MTDHSFVNTLATLLHAKDHEEVQACLAEQLAHFGFWGIYEGNTHYPRNGEDLSYRLLSSNLVERLGERSDDCKASMANAIKSSDPAKWRARMDWVRGQRRPWSTRELPDELNIRPSIGEVFGDFGLTAREVLAVPVIVTERNYRMYGCITDVQPSLSDVSSVIAIASACYQISRSLRQESTRSGPIVVPDRGSDRSIELSQRQREVLAWAAAGKTLQDIADITGLSRRTVRYHIESARDRYGFATAQQTIVRAALDYGLDPLGPRD